MNTLIVAVAVPRPLPQLFDYLVPPDWPQPPLGQMVVVGFGSARVIGVVWAYKTSSDYPLDKLKTIEQVLPLPALSAPLCQLLEFASGYYQAPLGSFLSLAVPKHAKTQLKRQRQWQLASVLALAQPDLAPVQFTAEQTQALAQFEARDPGFSPHLLWGVTGSGKTELYLAMLAQVLAQGKQVLVMVPEIGLTPRLAELLAQRLSHTVALLHSGLSDKKRLEHWLALANGEVQVALGARSSVFANFAKLGMIVVDEEHDSSLRAQEEPWHSARDLALKRAALERIPIVLASATPSSETYAHALAGHYRLLRLSQRANAAAQLAQVEVLDIRKKRLVQGMADASLQAIEQTLAQGSQVLVYLNRRGFAPHLVCTECAWQAQCPSCTSHLVFHLKTKQLRCHHCGHNEPVAAACPQCHNPDLLPRGQGTQRLEQVLSQRFPSARLLRMDRDSTGQRQAFEQFDHSVRSGEVDILVGTQMLVKGHDFPHLALVVVIGSDSLLHQADWRAPELLFSQMLQVAGRAGRAATSGRCLIQTRFPHEAMWAQVATQDYAGFMQQQLDERKQEGFPPFAHQALLWAKGRHGAAVRQWLSHTRQSALDQGFDGTAYAVNPIAEHHWRGVTAEQVLLQHPHRPSFHRFLRQWRQSWSQLSGVDTGLRIDPMA